MINPIPLLLAICTTQSFLATHIIPLHPFLHNISFTTVQQTSMSLLLYTMFKLNRAGQAVALSYLLASYAPVPLPLQPHLSAFSSALEGGVRAAGGGKFTKMEVQLGLLALVYYGLHFCTGGGTGSSKRKEKQRRVQRQVPPPHSPVEQALETGDDDDDEEGVEVEGGEVVGLRNLPSSPEPKVPSTANGKLPPTPGSDSKDAAKDARDAINARVEETIRNTLKKATRKKNKGV